jgi:hypothetical protein
MKVGDNPALSVVAYRGQVRISPGPPGELHIVATARGNDAFGGPDGRWLKALQVAVSEGHTDIRVMDESPAPGVGGDLVRAVDLEISLPTPGVVSVQTPNGLVSLVDLAGAFFLRTQTGPVSLRRLAGYTFVVGGVGSCTAQWLRGTLAGQLAGGSFQVRESLLDALDFTTSSGDIEVQSLVSPTSAYSLRAETGNIELQVPSQSRPALDISTMTGRLDYRLEDDIEKFAPGRWRLRTAGPSIQLASRSGDLAILPWLWSGHLPGPAMPPGPPATPQTGLNELRLLYEAWRGLSAVDTTLASLAALPPSW